MMIKSIVLFLLQGFILIGFLSPAGAFQVTGTAGIAGGHLHMHNTQTRTLHQHTEEGAFACLKLDRSLVMASSSSRPSTTALFAGKQKKPSSNNVDPPPPPKVVDGLRMFLAYATPWRNPNSIFVYMLLALFILGKYSEAKSAAGGAL